jgi:GDPmannose 4,6-dehydratase
MNEAVPVMGTAIVTGAAGQDGYFLTRKLLDEGMIVHAVVRRPESAVQLWTLDRWRGLLTVHAVDLIEPSDLVNLICQLQPNEFYHLAGLTSVSASFANPQLAWRTNVGALSELLEAVRTSSSQTRFYHSASSEMFGWIPGGSAVHNEDATLNPQSPYAAAKAAAHLLCRSYRQSYGLRIASGILFNHESYRRPSAFLTRKVVDHVAKLRSLSHEEFEHYPPLMVGNLKAQRDWGFAPDYVNGMLMVARQIEIRARRSGQVPEPDVGGSYQDYVLGTGELHTVWELVDRAFTLCGFALDWKLEGDDPSTWGASFRSSDAIAVAVDSSLLRPTDPVVIRADSSRARHDLGWEPRPGLDLFLKDMLEAGHQIEGQELAAQ